METGNTIIQDSQSAKDYDNQAHKTAWFGPEVVFGLAYEFIQPGGLLLDAGIGSGLSSILFHNAGLRIHGLDGSGEILEVCASKHFTEDLKRHDLRELPLPYPSRSYDFVVSVAVLNSFRDLAPLFEEFSRILNEQGILAFTVEDLKPGQEESYAINRVEVSEQPQAESAVMLFRHGSEYISRLLDENGFTLLKALEFTAFKYPAENMDILFTAYIAKRRIDPGH